MSLRQIPLVVWWIASIDPTVDCDQTALINSMMREVAEARDTGGAEYFIGYYTDVPMYFLVGFRNELQSSFDIATLLIGPLVTPELHFQLYQQAVRILLRRSSIDRITMEVDNSNRRLKLTLRRLGFHALMISSSKSRRLMTRFCLERNP